jgi:hypothetical protein
MKEELHTFTYNSVNHAFDVRNRPCEVEVNEDPLLPCWRPRLPQNNVLVCEVSVESLTLQIQILMP